MGVGSTILIFVLKTVSFVYDVITLPVYAIIQAPWTKKRDSKEAKVIKKSINILVILRTIGSRNSGKL